jgi:hypothetical protein
MRQAEDSAGRAIVVYPPAVKRAGLIYGLCGGLLIVALKLAEY